MNITEDQVEIVARHLQGLGWSSGGDYADDFKPDVRAALNHLAATQPRSPDAADSGRVVDAVVSAACDAVLQERSECAHEGLAPRARLNREVRAAFKVLQAALAAQGQSAAQPRAVPDGWHDFITECALCAGGEVNGNQLAMRATALLAASTQPGESHE